MATKKTKATSGITFTLKGITGKDQRYYRVKNNSKFKRHHTLLEKHSNIPTHRPILTFSF